MWVYRMMQVVISNNHTRREVNTCINTKTHTAPAARAPDNGDAAMMAATTMFFTPVIFLSNGVYSNVNAADHATIIRTVRGSNRHAEMSTPAYSDKESKSARSGWMMPLGNGCV